MKRAILNLLFVLKALSINKIKKCTLTQVDASTPKIEIITLISEQIDHIVNIQISPKLFSLFCADESKKIQTQLLSYRFYWIGNEDKTAPYLMIYDTVTRLLWDAKPQAVQKYALNVAKKVTSEMNIGSLTGWSLPNKEQLTEFASAKGCPLLSGTKYRLLDQCLWLTGTGAIDLDDGYWKNIPQDQGHVLAVNQSFSESVALFIENAIRHKWTVSACNKTNPKDLLAPLKLPIPNAVYANVDYLSARLPKLESAQFTDPNKGLWELWGIDEADLQGARGRNPAMDVKDWNVAIDFGTSSTVVAYEEKGQRKLLRIGVKDFFEEAKIEHYENPTVLEFVDLSALLKIWQSEAYRPAVSWDDVRCSHEALHNFRNNETSPRVVASILTKIKQWALREGNGNTVRITDQENGLEHILAPLTLRSPVKGQALEVSTSDPFDPVELYAWFLGLTINWRGRGIFLHYFMTFPVAYQKEVKEKILASFRRGLQRSLPATLINQEKFHEFEVEERSSEPAAYAVTALQYFKIEPTVSGTAYGFFDFGGGTADFDFGYYRLPNAEEEDEGWEKVFEHFGGAGDRFLGGENLLENLAYQVFRHNLEICRNNKIAFTKPLDADDFPGSELFLEKTQAAGTNTLMLIARLRPLWETGEYKNKAGVERIKLLNRDGLGVDCEFSIPAEALKTCLENRIEEGVHNFFAALKKAFADNPPPEIYVLLAGNASRSRWVLGFFGLLSEDEQAQVLFDRTQAYLEQLFCSAPLTIHAHLPLPGNENDVYQPNGKTGVALGLLQLCPGGVIKVVNHAVRETGGEALFNHYVGRIRQGHFQVGITQGERYDQWCELGPPRERIFNLVHSQSPKAHTGELCEGDASLYSLRIELAGNTTGQKVYARAKAPSTIEICTAISREAAEQGQCENLRQIKLE